MHFFWWNFPFSSPLFSMNNLQLFPSVRVAACLFLKWVLSALMSIGWMNVYQANERTSTLENSNPAISRTDSNYSPQIVTFHPTILLLHCQCCPNWWFVNIFPFSYSFFILILLLRPPPPFFRAKMLQSKCAGKRAVECGFALVVAQILFPCAREEEEEQFTSIKIKLKQEFE